MSDHHPFHEDSHEFIIGPVKKTNGSGPRNGALSTTWDAYIVREDDDIDEPEVEKPAPATVTDDGIEKRLVTIDTLNSERSAGRKRGDNPPYGSKADLGQGIPVADRRSRRPG